jgi:predicted transcriptional regulator
MKPPCTIVVQHILPAFRLEIARQLVKNYGMKRVDAANKMGVTPAAITQYLSRTRGNSATTLIEGSGRVMELIDDISADIAEGGSAIDILLHKLCKACTVARSEGLICELHKESLPSLSDIRGCSCFINQT